MSQVQRTTRRKNRTRLAVSQIKRMLKKRKRNLNNQLQLKQIHKINLNRLKVSPMATSETKILTMSKTLQEMRSQKPLRMRSQMSQQLKKQPALLAKRQIILLLTLGPKILKRSRITKHLTKKNLSTKVTNNLGNLTFTLYHLNGGFVVMNSRRIETCVEIRMEDTINATSMAKLARI